MQELKVFDAEDDETMSLWEDAHFYEIDPPDDIYDPSQRGVQIHPNPDWRSSIIFYTLTPGELDKLPTPTWRADKDGRAFVSYCLLHPASTKESARADKGDRVTRSKNYNLFLQAEYSLAIAGGNKDGWNAKAVPNPYAEPTDWVFQWSGKRHLLADLKKALLETKSWVANHPTFMREGGSMSTPEQKMARQERARKGRDVNAAKALARAQEALQLLDDGMSSEKLAQHLGISEATLPSYLSKARKRLREAAPVVEVEPSEDDEDALDMLSKMLG